MFPSFQVLICATALIQLTLGTSVDLDSKYHVTWHVNDNRTEVTFQVVVETTGWVGLGFSSNGAMTRADIFIGGVRDGQPYFGDYHGPMVGNGAPTPDSRNDFTIISASENETHTSLTFKRVTETCDPEDMPITEDGLRLIWAFGLTDTISYHGSGNRNVKSVYILDPEIPIPDLTGLEQFDIISKIKMPADKTTYWCSIHRFPQLPTNHHMIAYEPIFISNNSRTFTHHLNVLKCIHGPGEGSDTYGPWVDHEGVNCNDDEEENGFPGANCAYLEYGWALGGEIAVNPDNIGFAFNSQQFYKLEVHLNNPDYVSGEEVEIGMRIYHTPEIQEITASMLMIAAPKDYTLMVPPNASEFTTTAHCMPSCLTAIPESGVTAYNAFLHAHTSARGMRVHHYRHGVELPWILDDENFDFNYQTNRRLPKEVTILPGDQITAECIYDTTWKNGLGVIGGQSTEDEMCMVYIAYYPAIDNLVGCMDRMKTSNMFNFLGIEQVDKPFARNPTVVLPQSLAGKTFSSVVDEFNWTDELRAEYQLQEQFGEHETFCVPQNDKVRGYYPLASVFVPEETCLNSN